MMDPLSIATACLSLTGTITKLSFLVTGFVQDVRAARSDLDSVSRELLSLKTVLESLANDVAGPNKELFPETLTKQIAGIVTNCSGVVADIEQALDKHKGVRLIKAAKWVISGKNDVAKLRSSLEAHKSALEIALDMVTLTIAREIKADTNEIHNDTSAIKQDTAQILAQIARLQEQLPQEVNRDNTSAFMLERYLDNLTSYAHTVCDTTPSDVEEPPIEEYSLEEPYDSSIDSSTGSSIGASSQTWVTEERSFDLFMGNLCLDCPVPERILNKVPHVALPKRDEFTHVRYTALTCKPYKFNISDFALRQSLYGTPRRTEIFIAISLGKRADNTIQQPVAFSRTMRSVIRTIEYLEVQRNDESWGEDSWKTIVVGIVGASQIHDSTLSVLEDMGIYWPFDQPPLDRIALQNDATTFEHNPWINGRPVRASLYEYISQFKLHFDGLNFNVIRGSVPIQAILCLQKSRFHGSSYPWIKSFAEFLHPSLCVTIDAGEIVYPEEIYEMWSARNDAGHGRFAPVEVIPYKHQPHGR